MPTILELFRGSNKDITPTILDLTPVQELFAGSNKDITPRILDLTPVQELFVGSTQEKSVKPDNINLIKQELSGIRIKSKVELNNPLIYGNEAIRIATRSTSSVEKMKQATGGSAADGGLIGKGLGAITGGKFGKFLFGSKVTSLNQARDGINSRIGIPQNVIPTYVNNTGELQAGLESETMITLAKIKNDVTGTLVGKFLKQTGGGNPKTIGKQIIGQGISLGKDKLRTTLFGNPNSLGANTAGANDSFSGIDSGGKKPANGGWEYSSTLPYSKQISNIKFNSKSVSKVDKGATDITKKVVQLSLDAKQKLGEASSNLTASLKQRLKNGNSKTELDKFLDEKKSEASAAKLKEPSYDNPFTKILGDYNKNEDGEPTPLVKGGDKYGRIDLKLVSPAYGIDRRKTNGVFGTSPYAFKDIKNNTGAVMPNDPTNPYSGVAGGQKIPTLEKKYGITSNKGDLINSSYGVKGSGNGDDKDLVTFSIAGVGDSQKVYFRTLITSLSETVSPAWDSAKFVGNPYSYHTYGGVERTLSLQLKMYCMNSNELAAMWQRIDFLTKKAYPTISKSNLVNPPFIEFTLGNMYQKKTAFINSLSYTIPDDGVWETANGNQLPKIVEVQLEFKFVENVGAEIKPYGTRISKEAVKVINKRRADQSGTTTTVSEEPKTGGTSVTTNSGGTATAPQVAQAATPPPPINNVGVAQTEAPKTTSTSGGMLGVDSTPKSLDTGKPAETPKESNDGASLAAIVATTETSFEEKSKKAYEKYKSQGISDRVSGWFANQEAHNAKITNIKKIGEEDWFANVEYKDEPGYINNFVFSETNGREPYGTWVKRNNGNDPMNRFFKNNPTSKSSGGMMGMAPSSN
jgi:hypothetical protein